MANIDDLVREIQNMSLRVRSVQISVEKMDAGKLIRNGFLLGIGFFLSSLATAIPMLFILWILGVMLAISSA